MVRGKIETILNMSKKGYDIATISDCVNLSEEEVRKVLKGN